MKTELELFHSGAKGQKWGIRRYRNYDGTLTDEGKKRYYKYERKDAVIAREKRLRTISKVAIMPYEAAIRSTEIKTNSDKIRLKGASKRIVKNAYSLSVDDLLSATTKAMGSVIHDAIYVTSPVTYFVLKR